MPPVSLGGVSMADIIIAFYVLYGKGKAVPITGLKRPTGFQEVKAPRFRDIGT
jgi:hypothetical protein